MSQINDKAKTALFAYVGAVVNEQATRVNALMNDIKQACEAGDAAAAREATRQAVEEFITLGRAVDHASAAMQLRELDWPLNRGVSRPLDGLEADLGASKA
jgi:hypothetical protein